jgi:CheY-specific phosphatase CheX
MATMTQNTSAGNSPSLHQSSWEPLLCVGAQEVFEMMIGTTLTRCSPPEPGAFSEFTAIVGLAGPICGLFNVRCSSRAAVLITARMLHTSPEEAAHETADAMGEVCNMVIGHFKSKLGKIGEDSLLSVPTVVKGSDYKLRPLAKGSVIESFLSFAGELLCFRLEYKLTCQLS